MYGVYSLPPRSRGWTRRSVNLPTHEHASPALAGMDLSSHRSTLTESRFPRARGDGPGPRYCASELSRLPPRSRGWTRRAPVVPDGYPASPALAGMDRRQVGVVAVFEGFPRARGDGPGNDGTSEA